MRVTWTGSPVVGDSVTTLYFSGSGTGRPAAARAFFASFALALPAGLTITIPNGGDKIDDGTGNLAGSWSEGTAPAPVTGGTAGEYAKGVGMQVRWRTDGIVGSRRVVGSTFIVPIVGSVFDTDGSLDNATVAANLTAANALISSTASLLVWSRPTPSRLGTSNPVVGATAPDRVSWLRSRRS